MVKLVDLEDRSRQNNLRFEGIKEHENESWEDRKNKIYDLLENKFEMDIENVVIERAHRTRKKNKIRQRPIVAQFSFYKDKMNIFKNCKNFKNEKKKDFPSLKTFLERQLLSARKNGKKFLPIGEKV